MGACKHAGSCKRAACLARRKSLNVYVNNLYNYIYLHAWHKQLCGVCKFITINWRGYHDLFTWLMHKEYCVIRVVVADFIPGLI